MAVVQVVALGGEADDNSRDRYWQLSSAGSASAPDAVPGGSRAQSRVTRVHVGLLAGAPGVSLQPQVPAYRAPYLNLRDASRNSMICVTWSAVGLPPKFQEEGAGNAEIGDSCSTARIYERVNVLHGLDELLGVA